GREDQRLFDSLIPELPGILNWALTGWDRLHNRGHFVSPPSSASLIQQFEDLTSPVSAFVPDCCDVGQTFECPQALVFSVWRDWCCENGRRSTGTAQSFARYVRAALTGITAHRKQEAGRRVWYWQGFKVKDGLVKQPQF